MKVLKFITSTIVIFFLALSFIPGKSYSIDQSDINVTTNTPSITPPDYTKGECPVCDSGYLYWLDKGCCKLNINAGDAKQNVNTDCRQPNIVTCQKNSFCFPSRGCIFGAQAGNFQPFKLCDKLGNSTEKSNCSSCMSDNLHVWTGLGCFPVNIGALVSQTIIKLAVGLGGFMSFMVFVYGAFLVLTSAGDTERIQSGKKHISFALKGLLLIIFGVFILQIITINILKIPGFN